jgi:hypothetical protein
MSAAHPYRLSDAERDEAISALADAYADGRLTAAEFDERMAVASAARFAADLDGLFRDLPPRQAEPVPAARPDLRPVRRSRTGFPLVLVPIAALLAVLAIIGMPWFLLPMVVFWFAWGGPRRAAWHQPGGARRCGRW